MGPLEGDYKKRPKRSFGWKNSIGPLKVQLISATKPALNAEDQKRALTTTIASATNTKRFNTNLLD